MHACSRPALSYGPTSPFKSVSPFFGCQSLTDPQLTCQTSNVLPVQPGRDYTYSVTAYHPWPWHRPRLLWWGFAFMLCPISFILVPINSGQSSITSASYSGVQLPRCCLYVMTRFVSFLLCFLWEDTLVCITLHTTYVWHIAGSRGRWRKLLG